MDSHGQVVVIGMTNRRDGGDGGGPGTEMARAVQQGVLIPTPSSRSLKGDVDDNHYS